MSKQLTLVTEQLALVTRERDALLETARALRAHVECSKIDPEKPNQVHGPSKVCKHCFENLRAEHARDSIVIGSIRSVVREGMRIGRKCPFCLGLDGHHDTCYLHPDTGHTLLDEYAAIEQHRDMLLAERARTNGHELRPESTVRVSLKERYRQTRPA